jgi:malate dehydrogenase
MNEVAIVGAGDLGGALAHLLARQNIARTIRLIDDAGRIAAGKALDISQAAPIEGFATELSGFTEPDAAAGAAIVVLADRAGKGEWQGDEALLVLQRLSQMASGAVFLCAGASQRDVVDRGVGELHIPRGRLIGSAPEALAAAARALIALDTDGSPQDVALTVLGVPPDRLVIPWEDAAVGGFSAVRMIDGPRRRRIAARLPALWPPGPYALAAAAAKAIGAITGRSRQLSSCFVAADVSAGRRARTAALPVRLGETGVVEVVVPELNGHDRVALDNAMML